MDKFNRLIEFIFGHEGYKSDDTNDSGRLTIWGIASKFWPAEVAAMKTMTPEDAKEVAKGIYYRNYWLPAGCDNYPDKVALAIFDSAVNCGVPAVQGWLIEISDAFGTNPPIITAHDVIFKRQQYYINIVNRRGTQSIFLPGWIQRTIDIWTYKVN